jgi:NADH dehydrogenase/NADH:ubiquinone oxidoreductase subunit G
MSNPPAEHTPLASQPHQLQLALEQIDPKATAKKRPTWWLGMGIVLGSLVGYWATYNVTHRITQQWLATPLETSQVSPPATTFAIPQAAYAQQPDPAIASLSSLDIDTIEEAILDKKNYFDTQAEGQAGQQAQLTELTANQAQILSVSKRLEQQLATLKALPSNEDADAAIADIIQQLSSLAAQNIELMTVNQTALALRKRSYEQIRLLEQIEASKRGAEKHAQLAVHFHSQAKASVMVSLVLGVAAGSLGVLISREGWDKSDNRFVYAFALLSTMAVLFNQLPRVLQSEINFQNNRDIYLGYLTLRNNIHTFVATEKGVGVNPEEPDRFDDLQTNRFVHSVDAKLVELNQLRIGIDATQRVDISNVLAIPSR